jgi:hypothetical protein
VDREEKKGEERREEATRGEVEGVREGKEEKFSPNVLLGWDTGIGQLCKGEKATLYISAEYAYGQQGYPPEYPFPSSYFSPFLTQFSSLSLPLSSPPLTLLHSCFNLYDLTLASIPPNFPLMFDVELKEYD